MLLPLTFSLGHYTHPFIVFLGAENGSCPALSFRFFSDEQKKRHHQLRTVLCGRCKLLSHGHMVTAVGGHGGYPGGKQFVSAEQLREKLSYLRHEKALIVKLVNNLPDCWFSCLCSFLCPLILASMWRLTSLTSMGVSWHEYAILLVLILLYLW